MEHKLNDSLLGGDLTLEPEIDPNKNYLTELVGDGKKFKTPEELAKGKYHADLLIETKNKQYDDLRAAYLELKGKSDTQAKLEDLIAKLERPQAGETPLAEDKKPEIDYGKIESLIDTRVEQREASRKQTDNFNLVKSKLEEKYGDNYQRALKQQIEELGTTPEAMDNLARTNPKLAIKALGLDTVPQSDPFQAPPRTQTNSSFTPQAKKRTWSFYQEMKKNDPKKYFDPKTTIQMTQDYADLGSAFEDGNFKEYDRPGYLKFNS
jgi:hypothetical protein